MPKKGRRHNATGRSEYDSPYLQVHYWILETTAALQLSGTAFKVLLYLAKRFNGSNNGKIAFGSRSGCFIRTKGNIKPTFREVAIGIKPRTTSDALYELEKAGFIVCTKPSSFDQKRLVREWRLTWLPFNGQPATRDFLGTIGPFKRKQKSERGSALSNSPQGESALYAKMQAERKASARAPKRSEALDARVPGRPHVDPMHSASDALSAARALMEQRGRAASLALQSSRRFRAKPVTSGQSDANTGNPKK